MTEEEKEEERKAKIRKYAKEYYKKNKDRILKQRNAWYRKNAKELAEKRIKKDTDWTLENKTPDDMLQKIAARKAKKVAPEFREYIRELLEEYERNRKLDKQQLRHIEKKDEQDTK